MSDFELDNFTRIPDPRPVGVTSAGLSDQFARSDHGHELGRQIGGTVSRVLTPVLNPITTVTQIPWDKLDNDPQQFISKSLTLPQTTLTTPANCGGRYIFSFRAIGANVVGAGRALLSIVQNGILLLRSPMEQGGVTSVSGIFNLAVGDTIVCEIYQSAGNINFTAALDWIRIGPINA